jgi:hypothetical protein
MKGASGVPKSRIPSNQFIVSGKATTGMLFLQFQAHEPITVYIIAAQN